MPKLVDDFGRVVTKLRVSVTDRCNLRCVYCMPEGGLEWAPTEEILSFDEIARVVGAASTLGVNKVRITGGEPLLRPGIEELVSLLAYIPAIESVSLTTNGFFLADKAQALRGAGLRGINISLDSLDAEKLRRITRKDYFRTIMDGIDAARGAGLAPIKINAVIMRGYNDDEIEGLAHLARRNPLVVRFIEFMPLDAGGTWKRKLVVPMSEILERVRAVADVEEVVEVGCGGGEPARRFRFRDGSGEIGVIASVSAPFCESCNRVRLTADGKLLACLFSLDEHDVKRVLRSGGTDGEVAEFLVSAVKTKWAGHNINSPGFQKPPRPMSAIGG